MLKVLCADCWEMELCSKILCADYARLGFYYARHMRNIMRGPHLLCAILCAAPATLQYTLCADYARLCFIPGGPIVPTVGASAERWRYFSFRRYFDPSALEIVQNGFFA